MCCGLAKAHAESIVCLQSVYQFPAHSRVLVWVLVDQLEGNSQRSNVLSSAVESDARRWCHEVKGCKVRLGVVVG